MPLRPREYTDGKDRIVVRVNHKIDRERFIGTLAQSYLREHADGPAAPLTQARALYLLRMQLGIEGHYGGDCWTEPAWLEWARAETDRLWPERLGGDGNG
jgi:hypothetical protein